MDNLSISQIDLLAGEIMKLDRNEIFEKLVEINQEGKLKDIVNGLNVKESMEPKDNKKAKYGDILVFGDTSINTCVLSGIANSLGINKNRICYCNYKKSKNYYYNKLRNNINVAAILFGPVPHKAKQTEGYTSIISKIEKNPESYPPSIRVSSNRALKITKSSFRLAINNLMEQGVLVA